jgi:DNA helicase HerA-like ATPase
VGCDLPSAERSGVFSGAGLLSDDGEMKGGQPDSITYIGRTTFRNAGISFGIRQRDRRSHFYAIGKTGTGKSTLLYMMAGQDAVNGRGFALFDPHGDLAERLRALASKERANDLIYLNAADPALSWTFNPFAGVPEDKRALAAAGLVEVFKKLWPDDWGPRLEHLLRNVVYTLLENPGSTLADIPPLLTDKDFREQLVSGVENDAVRDFWEKEYAKYSLSFRAVVVAPLQNKIGALLTDPMLRRILTQDGVRLDLRSIMDEGKVLIVNLDKGRIGEGPAAILGSLLVSHIALAGISRSERPEEDRRDFFVYLDEFHTFATQSLATMLSELRKYRVGMILAHQHLSQLDPTIRDAVFGNVGTLISFRVGAADAQYIAREFAPTFVFTDLTWLPRYNMYIRLLIEGEQSRPFSARTVGSLHVLLNVWP